MALLNTIFVITVPFVVFGAILISQTFADDDDISALAPSPDYMVFENLPDSERRFLDGCANSLSEECGDEIMFGMFMEANITDECCGQLVKMGRTCDKHFVRLLLKFPELKPNTSLIMANAAKVWNHCDLVAKSDSAASPSST